MTPAATLVSVGITIEAFESLAGLPEGDVVAATDVFNQVWAERLPGERPLSVEAFVDLDRLTHAPEVVNRRLARNGAGEVVGFGKAEWREGEPGACIAEIHVAPAHRGAGAGSALGTALVDAARAAGRTGITVEAVDDGSLAPLFARAGFRPDMTVQQNRAPTNAASDDLLQGWVARGEAAEGYSLVAVDAPHPDELAEHFVAARHVMNDAPRWEGEPEAIFTLAEHRAAEAACAAARQDWWSVGVRDDDTGELVGLSEMYLPKAQPWIVYQGDTGVVPAHRGHGLGAWMKAVNHLRLRAERPQVETIQTWNASANEPMLRINRELGFHPVQTYRGWFLPFG